MMFLFSYNSALHLLLVLDVAVSLLLTLLLARRARKNLIYHSAVLYLVPRGIMDYSNKKTIS